MNMRLWYVALAIFLAGELASPALAQRVKARQNPPPAHVDEFDDFDDDDHDFGHQPYPAPRGQASPDEDSGNLFWLVVILVLVAAGGGGWYWWDHYDSDGGGFGD
ncbi:MAG: hypothetical protein L0Y71_24105 [Gemmataceae bacterium]|nr:hypothetical protein [Gemmataceae bacterium]